MDKINLKVQYGSTGLARFEKMCDIGAMLESHLIENENEAFSGD